MLANPATSPKKSAFASIQKLSSGQEGAEFEAMIATEQSEFLKHIAIQSTDIEPAFVWVGQKVVPLTMPTSNHQSYSYMGL